jgi:hypothetical protein
MVQRAFTLPPEPTEYAIGKTFRGAIDWVGTVRGASDALAATFLAKRELGDDRVSACPMQHLSDTDKALARAGRVIEVRAS